MAFQYGGLPLRENLGGNTGDFGVVVALPVPQGIADCGDTLVGLFHFFDDSRYSTIHSCLRVLAEAKVIKLFYFLQFCFREGGEGKVEVELSYSPPAVGLLSRCYMECHDFSLPCVYLQAGSLTPLLHEVNHLL